VHVSAFLLCVGVWWCGGDGSDGRGAQSPVGRIEAGERPLRPCWRAKSAIAIVDERGGLRELVTTDGWIWQPRVSPDGARLAYIDDGAVRVVDIASGAVETVGEGGAVDWIDDDTLVVVPFV
jgi:hypothetical protein